MFVPPSPGPGTVLYATRRPLCFRPPDPEEERRRRDEFVPARQAAARMGITLAEVETLAADGWLDAELRAEVLFVRPIILGRLRVHDPRIKPEPPPEPVETEQLPALAPVPTSGDDDDPLYEVFGMRA